jgi:hypothetical protein
MAKKMAILKQNTAMLCKNVIGTYFFQNRQFIAENWSKSPKMVIMTLIPGTDFCRNFGRKYLCFDYKILLLRL